MSQRPFLCANMPTVYLWFSALGGPGADRWLHYPSWVCTTKTLQAHDKINVFLWKLISQSWMPPQFLPARSWIGPTQRRSWSPAAPSSVATTSGSKVLRGPTYIPALTVSPANAICLGSVSPLIMARCHRLSRAYIRSKEYFRAGRR